MKLLNINGHESLVDVGCGTGSLLKVVSKTYPKLKMTGIDPDPKVLEIAHKKLEGRNVELIQTGADKLPMKTGSVDVVVSTLAFHHMPNGIKQMALQEIHRILKDDGKFLLVDFGEVRGLRILYYLEVILHIPENTTIKDNVDGKIPVFLQEAGFEYKKVAPRYRGTIDFIMATKS